MSEQDTVLLTAQNRRRPTGKPGGKGSRTRRNDARNIKFAPSTSKDSDNAASIDHSEGLQSTETLSKLKPAFALRPTAVSIDLHASNLAVKAMITRMRSIALRPLALLLEHEANRYAYRKVASYILTIRVYAAQQKVTTAAGVNLELQDAITADQMRVIDGRTAHIPNFFAWILSNIGYFERDSCIVVPHLPNPDRENTTVLEALRCCYFSVCTFIRRHREIGGVDFNNDDVDMINQMAQALPLYFSDDQHRFATETVGLFQEQVTGLQWDIFTDINKALAEQKCCVPFSLSDAAGTDISRLRFLVHDSNDVDHLYYCLDQMSTPMILSAIILRLGVDEGLPPDYDGRFVGRRNLAVLEGNDTPAVFLTEQLSMLTKIELS